MMFKATEVKYDPDPRLAKALDVLFILHADDEQNCSTNAGRSVGSSQVNRTRRSPPASPLCTARFTAAPTRRFCGCSAASRRWRHPGLPGGVKDREETDGFGHRVYKNYDPRARIIKKHVDEVLSHRVQPLVEIGPSSETGARRRVLHVA